MSNAPDTTVTQLPKPKGTQQQVSVDVNNPTSLYLDTAVFAQLNRVATMMCSSGLAPKHLQGPDKIADCILVVAQALRWKSDPFAVAQHTFVTQGKLGYEGKLIAAMVNSSGKLKENLNYEFSGEGDGRKVVVSGTLKSSDKTREIDGDVGRWKTANKFWKDNPDQMLAYRGAREWARRHMPEVLLGVNSEEEIAPRAQMVDVTPTNSAAALNQVLSNVAPQSEANDLRTVEGEIVNVRTGEIIDDDVERTIDEGTAAESDAEAARVASEHCDKLIEKLADMPNQIQIDAYVAILKRDLDALSEAERGRFNVAKYKREKAVKGK